MYISDLTSLCLTILYFCISDNLATDSVLNKMTNSASILACIWFLYSDVTLRAWQDGVHLAAGVTPSLCSASVKQPLLSCAWVLNRGLISINLQPRHVPHRLFHRVRKCNSFSVSFTNFVLCSAQSACDRSCSRLPKVCPGDPCVFQFSFQSTL